MSGDTQSPSQPSTFATSEVEAEAEVEVEVEGGADV